MLVFVYIPFIILDFRRELNGNAFDEFIFAGELHDHSNERRTCALSLLRFELNSHCIHNRRILNLVEAAVWPV